MHMISAMYYQQSMWITLPCRITLVRMGPQALDTDNLSISAKHVRDGIADALQLDDADPRLTWEYAQERRKTYGVRVEIEVDA